MQHRQQFLLSVIAIFMGVPLSGTAAEPASIDFERDIQPVLTRHGCNAGACHGKQRGQNGFQLSLLGFDSDFDHAALTKEGRSRRVTLSRPESSLLLTKPAGLVPHGGGIRLPVGSPGYQLLSDWIAAGAPRRIPGTPALIGIEVARKQRDFTSGQTEQLTLTARYADDSTRDVTGMATYQSSESPIAAVDEHGLVTAGRITGEATIMARYQGHFALFVASVPLPGNVPADYYAQLPRANFIDEHIINRLARLQLHQSAPAADEKFLRRVYVDIIGRVPTADEAAAFLDDSSTDKREQLVDRLLDNPEYAEHWANKWVDLLRPNPYRAGIKATMSLDTWIRSAFRRNQPYDEFVHDLLTAQGSTFRNGAVTLFRDRRSPDELTTITSQLFLGVRLECAKCHHHPFEVYGQEDFYSFAAYFAKIARKGRGVSPPISGSEEFVYVGTKGEVKHPLTDEVLTPQPLFGDGGIVKDGEDPRKALADWLTSKDNAFFAQTMANRIWADLMGRGIVEPVDDLRSTNPPANPELLTALGKDFAENGYDIKQLIRRIVLSQAYGLGTQPVTRNVMDTRYHSRYYRQRLRAEVLLDSVCQITGVPESFAAMPRGSRAKELWTHRIGSLFLDAYGRPDPNQDPPCERTSDSTVVQALHLMNSENLYRKVTSDNSTAAVLAKSDRTPEDIVEQLYLSIYSRRPTAKERETAVGFYTSENSNRRQVTEDLMWAMLNTPEFWFKD